MLETQPQPGVSIEQLAGVATPPEAVVLATSQQVLDAIHALAKEIHPWVDQRPEEPVVLVALLQGGKFYADLLSDQLRQLCTADFSRADIKVSTRDDTGLPLSIPGVQGSLENLRGRRVLVVDDILDSGLTIKIIREQLSSLASELKVTVLVQKDPPGADLSERPTADFTGLRFTDTRWFSGAGMDMPGDPEGMARKASTIIAYPPLFSS